jgi:PIN domain nuclease of toxin-antitoxin system
VTSPPLLDTHAWLWWLDGSRKLTARELRTLDALAENGRRQYVCAISLWEIALLVERERVVLGQTFDSWIELAASPGTVRLIDVTPAIAKELPPSPAPFLTTLPTAATARTLELPVLTRDMAIRRSGLVHLWKP